MKLAELSTESEVTLELAPLIDVLFLIVLFYAVSSSLISPQDLTALQDRVARLTTETQTLTGEVEDRSRRLTTMEAALATTQSDLAHRDESLGVERARAATLDRDLAAARLNADQLRQRSDEANLRSDQVRRTLAERETALDQERLRSGQYQQQNAALTAQLTRQAEAVGLEQTRAAALERALSEQRRRSGELEATLAEREAALAAEAARLEQLRREIAAREQALAEQAQRIVIMDQSLAEIRSRLARSEQGAEQGRAQATAQAQAQTQALEQQVAENRRLQAELDQARAARQAEIDAGAAARAELAQIRQQIATISAENDRLRAAAQVGQERVGGAIEAERRLTDNLQSLIQDRTLGVTRTQDRLVLELSDKILFDSGSDELKPAGRDVLANVGKVLADRVKTLQIQVGGHTDNVGLGRNNRFDSNWALSAARAVNVVRFFEQRAGIDPSRLAAVGYGEFQPIASNDSADGRAKNRRIEIVLLAR